MSKSKDQFRGPVFIIGMPRSGTKLLRGLLNEHSRIRIPDIETGFIPYWAKHWKCFGNLSIPSNFNKFYKKTINFPYFIFMREKGMLIDEKTWFRLCKGFLSQDVFEALIRHDVEANPQSDIIWGDKSPSYINELPLLKSLFPNARFIHIIRDVRDYCLSINKAWGKNMIRAAYRWSECIQKARSDARLFQQSYIEIKYEDLLSSAENELMNICKFLELDFDSKMLSLSKATENIGDTKDEKRIVTNNYQKYTTLLSPLLLKRIEGITRNTLESCGYSVNYRDNIPELTRFHMVYFKILDAYNLLKYREPQWGLIRTIRFHLQHFVETTL